MNWVVWLGIGVIAFGVVMIALYLEAERRPRPVLPSHYDVQNYTHDPSTIPGWCVNCETMNDPDYRFCENCTAELPTSKTDATNTYSSRFSS